MKKKLKKPVLVHLISQRASQGTQTNIVQYNRKPKIRATPGNQS